MELKLIRLASIFGMLAVGFGAFGAHALKESLIINGLTETYKTAVLYHFIHTLALLILSKLTVKPKPIIAGLWISGIILFSGSLYLIAIFQLPLGVVTPFGGIAFIAGWLMLAIKATKD